MSSKTKIKCSAIEMLVKLKLVFLKVEVLLKTLSLALEVHIAIDI